MPEAYRHAFSAQEAIDRVARPASRALLLAPGGEHAADEAILDRLDDAVSLAVASGRMPGRLIVHAIEAEDLTLGAGLAPAVPAAVSAVTQAVLGGHGPGLRPCASGQRTSGRPRCETRTTAAPNDVVSMRAVALK